MKNMYRIFRVIIPIIVIASIGAYAQVPKFPADGGHGQSQPVFGIDTLSGNSGATMTKQSGGSGGVIPQPPVPGSGTQIGGFGSLPQPPQPGSGYPIGTLVHVLNLPAGWSGISSLIVPFNPSFSHIFGTALGNLTLIQNFSRLYWPAYGINMFGNWNSHEGYAVRMQTNSQATLIGFPSSNRTVQLNTGWNYLPVISECAVNTQALLQELVSQNKLVIVKAIGGSGMYWPQANINTLPTLYPGLAYMIKVNQACTVSFPACQ